MKTKPIALHILVAACTILFITVMYVLVNMTNGQIDIERYWIWLITLPVGASGLLYLAREFKR